MEMGGNMQQIVSVVVSFRHDAFIVLEARLLNFNEFKIGATWKLRLVQHSHLCLRYMNNIFNRSKIHTSKYE